MSLKSAIQKAIPPAFHMDKRTWVDKAWARLSKRWDEVTEKEPLQADQRQAEREAAQLWADKKDLAGLQPRVAKLLPWCLFRENSQSSTSLGADDEFANAFVAWIAQWRAGRLRTLLHTFLLDYPTQNPAFHVWRSSLQVALLSSESLRLEGVRERCERHAILAADGTVQFARELVDPGTTVEEVFADAGFVSELRFSAFVRTATQHALDLTRMKMKPGSATLAQVQRIEEVVESPPRQLAFSELGTVVAEALLMPFESASPDQDVVECILAVCFRHLKDPRMYPAEWRRVSAGSQAVMRRWLAHRDMELFFDVVGATAYDGHWKYRKTFWKAYLDRGVVDDVWLVLGATASDNLRRTRPDVRRSCGQINDRAQGDKCALMMKIGGFTFVEWSHNGACRVWASDKSPPKMFKPFYGRDELMGHPGQQWSHMNSDAGGWQSRIENFVRWETGIRLQPRDYMP